MAQAWTEEKLLKEDPLHDVTKEIQHGSPHLKHVDLQEKAPEDEQMEEGVIKSHVPEAFAEELRNDHSMTEAAQNVGGTDVEFMQDDPLHDVKQELENHSPRLKHIEIPKSPASQDGEVVKSEVPEAFEEELKNDHDIVKGRTEGVAPNAGVSTNLTNLSRASARGKPLFRISAHHGMRPGGTLSRDFNPEPADMCVKDETFGLEESVTDAKPEESGTTIIEDASASKALKGRSGLPARGGLSSSGPRRGGLARTGSGVPGEQKGGSSLVRTGSGVPGNSLARQGSGIPSSKGGSDLKDFASFLDAGDEPSTTEKNTTDPKEETGFFHKMKEGMKDQLLPPKDI